MEKKCAWPRMGGPPFLALFSDAVEICAEMHERGESLEKMLSYIKTTGCTYGQAVTVLNDAGVMFGGEAKKVVYDSGLWES